MSHTCAVCGKEFYVLYPDLYVYKRWGNARQDWMCSYGCMRKYDKGEKDDMTRVRLTKEQKAKAVEIAIGGGSPEEYLEELGMSEGRVSWYNLRMALKKNDPETFAKLPEKMRKIGKDEAPAATVKIDGPIRIETPESGKVQVVEVPEKPKQPKKPLTYEGYTVKCIEGQYGRFYWDEQFNRLDWTAPGGEEVSLSPQAWKTLCTEEVPKVMAILGVNP